MMMMIIIINSSSSITTGLPFLLKQYLPVSLLKFTFAAELRPKMLRGNSLVISSASFFLSLTSRK